MLQRIVTVVILLSSVALGIHASVLKMECAVGRRTFVQQDRSSPDHVHELVFAVQQRSLDVVERELLSRSTPGSIKYQQWLTFNEIGEIMRNTAAAAEVTNWLQNNGVNVTWQSRRHEYIKATAPILTWEKLLSTTFYTWEDKTKPVHFTRTQRTVHRAVEYTLPDTLKPHLSAVFNTVQTPPEWKPKYHRAEERPAGSLRKGKKEPLDLAVNPPFLNALYWINSNAGSAAQQQAVFETNNEFFSSSDLTRFQKKYNLPLQAVSRDFGHDTIDCKGRDCYEGNLDVQYLMGVAQDTQMVYWYQGGNDPFIDWITAVADDPNPPLVNSISWGSTEQANSEASMKAFNNEAMKLAAMGVTIVVSSGDNGAAGDDSMCDVGCDSKTLSPYWQGEPWTGAGYFPSFPATSPYVTAVGATMGPERGNPEIACQSQLGGVITTGGGFSTYNPTPSWQTNAVNAYFASLSADSIPTSGYNPNGRGYPDVSLIGVYYKTFIADTEVSLFGTSASAPVFGAMISLINAARAAKNQSSVGFINPTLWAFSNATEGNPYNLTLFQAYTDVTSGNTKCMAYGGWDYTQATCCESGFTATAGWDPVTGFGSITLPNLMRVLSTEVVVPLNYTDDDDSASPQQSQLYLIIALVLAGATLVATLIGGTIYALCVASRAPSNYAPAGRMEVAMTQYPDTQLQTVTVNTEGYAPQGVQCAAQVPVPGSVGNPMLAEQTPGTRSLPLEQQQLPAPVQQQKPPKQRLRLPRNYAALPADPPAV